MGQFIDQKQKEVEFFNLFQEMKNLLIATQTQLSCYLAALPDSKKYDYKADCIEKLTDKITETLEKVTSL